MRGIRYANRRSSVRSSARLGWYAVCQTFVVTWEAYGRRGRRMSGVGGVREAYGRRIWSAIGRRHIGGRSCITILPFMYLQSCCK